MEEETEPVRPQPLGTHLMKAELHFPEDAIAYTCPMHPDVREHKPGSCPKCGMALERVAPQTAAEKIEYTCPMHPQVARDKPKTVPSAA